jgi:hypothetical protein
MTFLSSRTSWRRASSSGEGVRDSGSSVSGIMIFAIRSAAGADMKAAASR